MNAQILLCQFAFAVLTAGGCYQTYTLFRDQPINWSNAPQAGVILGLGALCIAATLFTSVMMVKIPTIMAARNV